MSREWYERQPAFGCEPDESPEESSGSLRGALLPPVIFVLHAWEKPSLVHSHRSLFFFHTLLKLFLTEEKITSLSKCSGFFFKVIAEEYLEVAVVVYCFGSFLLWVAEVQKSQTRLLPRDWTCHVFTINFGTHAFEVLSLQVEALFILELHPRVENLKERKQKRVRDFLFLLQQQFQDWCSENHSAASTTSKTLGSAAPSEDCIYLHLGCLWIINPIHLFITLHHLDTQVSWAPPGIDAQGMAEQGVETPLLLFSYPPFLLWFSVCSPKQRKQHKKEKNTT